MSFKKNKLVGIGLSKKKDKKEIAKLAFAAATADRDW